jgi:uncharacterized protein with PQ loop repeat
VPVTTGFCVHKLVHTKTENGLPRHVMTPAPPPGHGCHAAYAPIEPSGIALGWFLTIATLLAPLPQYVALCRSRSSYGISLLTPLLNLVYGVLNLCSAICTKWPSIQRCGHSSLAGAFGLHGCVDQLLDMWQIAISALSGSMILVLVVLFPPHNVAKERALVVVTLSCLTLTIFAACYLSALSPCSEASHTLSQTFAVLSAVVVVVAFAPQLYETWRTRGAGSLSSLYYLIQSIGTALVVVLQLVALRDSILVWGPNSISMAMQGGIFSMLCYYRRCAGRCSGGTTGTDPLLVVQESAQAATAVNDGRWERVD